MNRACILMLGIAVNLGAAEGHAAGTVGEDVYAVSCAACHKTGLLGAPRTGQRGDWAPRVEKGSETLLDHALNGFKGRMPPRGGNTGLSDEQVRSALEYMLARIGVSLESMPRAGSASPAAIQSVAASGQTENVKREKAAESAEPAGMIAAVETARKTESPAVASETAKPGGVEAVVQTTVPKSVRTPAVAAEITKTSVRAPAAATRSSGANAFNRLMKPPSKRNPSPMEDGIHDPGNAGTRILQAPRESFASLPRSRSGNRVDWVKSLEQARIAPRFDLVDPDKQPVVMDLNIVREVKGSMPDVVYPHKQHTEWLDCSNCHPAIFKPQKGANAMSMAGILLGKQCGVCHGKVAFPVAECRKCHSRKKPKATKD